MDKIILVDAANTFVTEDGKKNLDMQNMLDGFSHRKIIVTNANEEEKITYGIVDMPYDVFSLAHNPNKTDAAYFAQLMDILGCEAEDLIYFEHNPDAVTSAKSLGIKSHHYDKAKKDIAAVKDFIEKNI